MGAFFVSIYDASNYYRYSGLTQDLLEFFSGILIALGLISVMLGAVSIYWGYSKPIITRKGKIIEKQSGVYDVLLVEFEDGKREQIISTNKIILSVGDEGKISTQGQFIVDFEK